MQLAVVSDFVSHVNLIEKRIYNFADYQLINSSTSLLNLTMTFHPLSMFRWQLYSAQTLRNRFNIMGNLMGEEDEDQDQDSVKEVKIL